MREQTTTKNPEKKENSKSKEQVNKLKHVLQQIYILLHYEDLINIKKPVLGFMGVNVSEYNKAIAARKNLFKNNSELVNRIESKIESKENLVDGMLINTICPALEPIFGRGGVEKIILISQKINKSENLYLGFLKFQNPAKADKYRRKIFLQNMYDILLKQL
jgi:hypothetical protein